MKRKSGAITEDAKQSSPRYEIQIKFLGMLKIHPQGVELWKSGAFINFLVGTVQSVEDTATPHPAPTEISFIFCILKLHLIFTS